jgi:iron complex outermembrane recepter protein
MNLTPSYRLPAFGASALLGVSLALAQPPPSGTRPKPGDEVVTLSEFSVQAETDRGYVASETMTGSRVATKIIDLPYTVNVLTSEFFDDFAMFELADNITQIGSFTNLDIGGGFQLRGFSSTSQLRDGFYRLGRYGSSNVDRMEIIKGSNAAIYGRTSPGGMVNMISKLPKSREYQTVRLSYGNFDQRALLESTGPLFHGALGNTNYIFTASEYQKKFEEDGIDFARNRNHEYYLALKHQFADNSSLTLQAEYFLQIRHAPPSSAPLVTDFKGTASNLDDVAIGYAKDLALYNPGGPNSELNRGNISYTATYEKRFTDVWSARVAGSYFRARRWDFNSGGWGSVTINNPTASANYTTTRGANPTKGLIMEDGGGVQADALAHYWLANHTLENRTLVTIDFNDYYRWDPTWNIGANTPANLAWTTVPAGSPAGALAPNVLRLNPDFTPAAPISYFPSFFQWGSETLNRLTRRRTTVLGGLLRQQTAFFQGALLTYVGARYDAVRFQERDFRNTIAGDPGVSYPPGAMIRKLVHQLKPNVGANYKLTSQLRVFANYSQSYFVNQTDNPDAFAVSTYKPETAAGYDYGFKGELLNGRLNFTVSGFYATRENVSVSQVVETSPGVFITTNVRDGNQLVRGYEADVNWRATDEISLNGSYGNVYSIYTDFGSASPLSVGRRVNGVSPYNGSITAKWSPRASSLNGFSANVGWTFVGATPSEAPNAGDTYTTTTTGQRVLARTTYQWALKTPAFDLLNVGVRYAFRSSARFEHMVALNVNNAFDKDYLKTNRQIGEPRSVIFTYTLGYGGGSH